MANEKAKEVLEIGDRMKDGTVVIAVDLKKNIALFAPQDIFAGCTEFNNQDNVVVRANAYYGLHGHKDWRRITNKEARALTKDWNKIARPSTARWFWGAPLFPYFSCNARIYRGGESGRKHLWKENRAAVPIVRSGPAQAPKN